MSDSSQPEVRPLLQEIAMFCIRSFVAGQNDEQVVSTVVAQYGVKPALAVACVKAARSAVTQQLPGDARAARSNPRDGIAAAVADAFAEHRAQARPGRRLGIRIPCLLVGAFLAFASAGGFRKGETAAAVVILALGLGVASVFLILRPAQGAR